MERRCRKRWRSDRPQTCGLRARFPDSLSTHRFACFDGQQSGRECIFLFRTALRFACAVFRIFAPPSPYGGAVFRRCGRPVGVSSRLQPLRGLRLCTSCARHFSPSGLHLFASICSRKIPEMTYTPSFLMKASFFRYFVKALSREWALHMPIRGFFLCNFAPLMARA